jgi:ferric-dicitrate binding protein FerR (iron transport regulator)
MTSFESLLSAYRNDTLTPAELNELLQLLDDNDTVLKDSILNDLQRNAFAGNTTAMQRQRMFDNIITAAQNQRKARVVQLWKRVAVAAAIIVLAGAGTYLLMNRKPENTTAGTSNNVKQDVMPGGNKAVLTLADGSTIVLDSARNGSIAQQGNANVIKQEDGQLIYRQGENAGEKPLAYNTLATPRGGQYQLVLPDGSKVWLNAASSIRYPVAFTGDTREVEMEGEGYFEITKNAAKPFHVKTKTQDVEVLGTHFNVNAYDDEDVVKTTLLEGSVKVKADNSVVLKPGEQAELSGPNSQLTTHHSPNIDQVMSWKNGQFYFSNIDLETIMRQMARWYDVQVEYKVHPADKYTVSLSRNVPVSKLLSYLELSGGVKFKIEGKKVIVM